MTQQSDEALFALLAKQQPPTFPDDFTTRVLQRYRESTTDVTRLIRLLGGLAVGAVAACVFAGVAIVRPSLSLETLTALVRPLTQTYALAACLTTIVAAYLTKFVGARTLPQLPNN